MAVDENTLMPSLGVKSFLLLDIDGSQSAASDDHRHCQGRKSSEEHIEKDEPQERSPEGGGGNPDEPATDSHEFKGQLKPLEHGISTVVYFHSPAGLISEELRQGSGHGQQSGTTADGHHDGLLDILIAVLELVVAVEGSDEADDGSKDIEEVTHRLDIALEGTHGLRDGRGARVGKGIARATDEHHGQCGQSH